MFIVGLRAQDVLWLWLIYTSLLIRVYILQLALSSCMCLHTIQPIRERSEGRHSRVGHPDTPIYGLSDEVLIT